MMLTPEAIREVFDEHYDYLLKNMDVNTSRDASRFALATRNIAMAGLPKQSVLAGAEIPECNVVRYKLLAYLDNAILKAEIAAYNLEWDVDLKVEPEQKEASDG